MTTTPQLALPALLALSKVEGSAVEGGERPKNPTQMELILALLGDRQFHSTVELHAICWRYGARLWDLRKRGYRFEKRRVPHSVIEEWRLVGRDWVAVDEAEGYTPIRHTEMGRGVRGLAPDLEAAP
jgi:hypothetical protein